MKFTPLAITLALLSIPASAQSLGSVLKDGVVAPKKQTPPQSPPQTPPTSAPQHTQPPAHQGRTAQPPTAPAPPAAPTPNQGQGYRMNLPPGWQSQITRGSSVVARSGDSASLVMVAPFTAPPNTSAAEYMRRYGALALRSFLPEAAVTAVQPSRIGQSGALSSVQFRGPAGPGRASVLCFTQGGVGTLYVIAAPAAQYDQQRTRLVAILRSFSFTGAGPAEHTQGAARPAAAPPSLSFTRFQDPNEQSFTVDVPAGWNVRGGTVRKSTVDVRSYLRLTSPDGAIVIASGDPELGGFVVPTPPVYGMGGLVEGKPYPGGGAMVMRYLPGPVFARNYVGTMARLTGASNVQLRDVRERTDLSSRVSGVAQQTITAGEASFSCVRNGRESAGYVLAGTRLTTIADSSMWWVTTLLAWVAPPDQTPVVDAVIQRLMKTFQVNPSWFGQQQQLTAETSRIVTKTNEEVSRIITDNYWSRQKSQDRTNRNFSDYIRGTVRLKDPESGEELEGTAGKNYYWRVRNTNTIVGSDTPGAPPNIDVTELEQVR